MEEYLSDIEREKVVQFNTDEVMVEAVRKVLLKVIYAQGVIKPGKKTEPLTNGALALVFKTIQGGVVDNEKLGEDLRGMAHGINYLESGFIALSKIKSVLEGINPPAKNEAI